MAESNQTAQSKDKQNARHVRLFWLVVVYIDVFSLFLYSSAEPSSRLLAILEVVPKDLEGLGKYLNLLKSPGISFNCV